MCVPPAAASAGLKLVQGVMKYNTAVANYDQTIQTNFNNRMSATRSRDLQISQSRLRNEQEQARIADEKLIKMAEAYKKEAAYKVAVGEDGIVGRTILRGIDLRVGDRLRDINKLDTTGKSIVEQSLMDARGIQAQLEGRLGQIVDPVKPNLGAYMAEAAVGAATSYAGIGGGTTWSDIGTGTGLSF